VGKTKIKCVATLPAKAGHVSDQLSGRVSSFWFTLSYLATCMPLYFLTQALPVRFGDPRAVYVPKVLPRLALQPPAVRIGG
jgi:hypothetical protein